MGLLSEWFNFHKKYIGEGITNAGFIKLIVPEDFLSVLYKSEGSKSIRFAKQIVNQDFLGASKGGGPVAKGCELQNELRDNPQFQYKVKEKLETYERKYLTKDIDLIKEFSKHLGDKLLSFRKPDDRMDNNQYNKNCERLSSRIIGYDVESNAFAGLLYAYLYFALFKYLPVEFAYNDYGKYDQDFEEYRKKIIDSLGIYSLTGMAMLYALAERGMDKRKTQENANLKPNIIALFAKGQLEYYGRGPSGKRNIPEAYECYKKVRELNPYHPMARWAIADLKLSYESGHIKCEIEDFERQKIHRERPNFVDEQTSENGCDFYYSEEWYKGIRDDLKMAASFGSAPAKNLLGRIIQGKDKEGRIIFPKKYLGDLISENAEKYYQESADMGYVFAYINLYECQKFKAENNMEKSEKDKFCKSAFENLMKAADLGLPYAANKVSQYFLKNNKDIVADIVVFDEDKAFMYAKKALDYAKMTHNGYWPFYNIVEFFYYKEKSKYYKKIEIERMKDYLKLAKSNCSEDSKDRESFLKKVDELEKRMYQER